MIGKLFSGAIGGLIVAILGSMIVVFALASNPEFGSQAGAVAFFVFWAIALVVAISAPRAGKAWRRLLIISGLLAFAMPILSFIFTGVQVTSSAIQGSEYSGAVDANGAALGEGMVATVITGFLGFFLGLIFLVIGLLIGRDKQVIVANESNNEE